jgi:hypothetical protein
MFSTDEVTEKLPSLDTLSTYLVLTGFASICCDSLEGHFLDRKCSIRRLSSCFETIHKRLLVEPESDMKAHSLMTYYISMISLHTSLHDLEMTASSGFSLIGAGTPIEPARAAMIRILTRNKVGENSAQNAIQLLRVYMVPSTNSISPYKTSALYLGALTLWAYALGHGYDHEVSDAEALRMMTVAMEASDVVECGKNWRGVVLLASECLASHFNEIAREYSEVLLSVRRADI